MDPEKLVSIYERTEDRFVPWLSPNVQKSFCGMHRRFIFFFFLVNQKLKEEYQKGLEGGGNYHTFELNLFVDYN